MPRWMASAEGQVSYCLRHFLRSVRLLGSVSMHTHPTPRGLAACQCRKACDEGDGFQWVHCRVAAKLPDWATLRTADPGRPLAEQVGHRLPRATRKEALECSSIVMAASSSKACH